MTQTTLLLPALRVRLLARSPCAQCPGRSNFGSSIVSMCNSAPAWTTRSAGSSAGGCRRGAARRRDGRAPCRSSSGRTRPATPAASARNSSPRARSKDPLLRPRRSAPTGTKAAARSGSADTPTRPARPRCRPPAMPPPMRRGRRNSTLSSCRPKRASTLNQSNQLQTARQSELASTVFHVRPSFGAPVVADRTLRRGRTSPQPFTRSAGSAPSSAPAARRRPRRQDARGTASARPRRGARFARVVTSPLARAAEPLCPRCR